jgi:hypothetical protein
LGEHLPYKEGVTGSSPVPPISVQARKPSYGWVGFTGPRPGYLCCMSLALLLIVIGIILAVLVNYALGIICIVIGLVLLLLPWLRGRSTSRV